MKKGIIFTFFILAEILAGISSVHAQGLGKCPLGQYPLGNCEIETPPITSGGGGGSGEPAFNFGIDPIFIGNELGCINNSYQIFQKRCFLCPVNGIIKYNLQNNSLFCDIPQIQQNSQQDAFVNKTIGIIKEKHANAKKIFQNVMVAITMTTIIILILATAIALFIFKKLEKKIKSE